MWLVGGKRVNCGVPQQHIREMATGKKEENKKTEENEN